MPMDTPQDKGDALENAVAAIEEIILRSSEGTGKKPTVEKKKIVRPAAGLESSRLAVEVERPLASCAAGRADKSGRFQNIRHALRRMNERAKRVSPEPIPEVFQHNGGAHVPHIARIGERDHMARASSRSPEKRFHIGVTTNDAVERDDIGVGQGVCRRSEVAEEKLSGARSTPRGEVAPGGFKITG